MASGSASATPGGAAAAAGAGTASAPAAQPTTAGRTAWDARLLDVAAAVGLLAATALLYHDATRLWWLADDFFNVRWVHAWSPAEYALDPGVWRQLPFRMLTPLLFVSYDVDLALFGPRPFGFYLHQLAALGLAAAALYALLRRWLERGWALFGAWLFLAGPPVLSLAPLVMVRHYVECVLLGALAALAWVAAVRSRRRAAGHVWAALAGLLWLAAALAKEIAVPLLLVLPLLPEGAPGKRLRLAWPLAFALVAYVAYRWYLLGVLGGGYGWVATGAERARLAVALPVRIGAQLLGAPSAPGWLALAVVLAGTAMAAARGRRAALLVAGGMLLAVLPVLPVATEVVPRYAVAAWTVLAVACPLGLRRARWGGVAAAIAALALLLANRGLWESEMAARERMSAEYRALLELGPGETLRQPAGPPASLVEVGRFGDALLGREARARWFLDDLYLCRAAPAITRLWEYGDRERRLVDRTAEVAALRRRHCGALRPRAPLSVRIERDGAVLRWALGPHREGRWAFVFEDGVTAYAVPRNGAFHTGGVRGPFRVRYDAPAGWTTYSRELVLGAEPGARVSWQRPRPAGPPTAPPHRAPAPPPPAGSAGQPATQRAAPPATAPGG